MPPIVKVLAHTHTPICFCFSILPPVIDALPRRMPMPVILRKPISPEYELVMVPPVMVNSPSVTNIALSFTPVISSLPVAALLLSASVSRPRWSA